MRLRQLGLGLTVSALTALPASGALVISEALANEVSSDTTGEFMEVFNNGTTAIDLSTYRIGDEETNNGATGMGSGEAMHFFPAGATIAAGEVQVVAASAQRFFDVYGFLPTYERAGTHSEVPDLTNDLDWDPDGGLGAMANGSDQLLILDSDDNIVDAVSWGNTFAFDPGVPATAADGQSYERKNVYVDTNTAEDWQLGPTNDVNVQRSTPGVANVPEPGSLALVAAGALLALRRTRRE